MKVVEVDSSCVSNMPRSFDEAWIQSGMIHSLTILNERSRLLPLLGEMINNAFQGSDSSASAIRVMMNDEVSEHEGRLL